MLSYKVKSVTGSFTLWKEFIVKRNLAEKKEGMKGFDLQVEFLERNITELDDEIKALEVDIDYETKEKKRN